MSEEGRAKAMEAHGEEETAPEDETEWEGDMEEDAPMGMLKSLLRF